MVYSLKNGSTSTSDPGVPILVSGRQLLVDEQNREAGETHVMGTLRQTESGLDYQCQLARCETRLEVGEQVARVTAEEGAQMGLVPFGPDALAITSVWSASSLRGNQYRTLATTRLWSLPSGFEGMSWNVRVGLRGPPRSNHVDVLLGVTAVQ